MSIPIADFLARVDCKKMISVPHLGKSASVSLTQERGILEG